MLFKNFFWKMSVSFAAALLMASCSGKDNDALQPADAAITIRDLPADTAASMGEGVDGKEKRPFYTTTFSFKNQQTHVIRNAADSASYLQNADWDIAFSKEYNSFVVINNGKIAGTPGYKGPGVGNLVIVEQPFDNVTTAPSDEVFQSQGLAGVGWDNGNGLGWFFYSLNNHICVPVRNRTFVLKTATGNFAKLEILNIYKGNPPVVTDLFWPAPYLTFRYFVQTDGSRNLKNR
ncbi:HmuY protein [Chitinophaga ginsengisegetis]|uniref:HmuY protein n=2 Tax=Chitinophaga ginsengisegetis TaxID=393003 RepID=A0A1T5PCB6_9BACT|nr:HmuY protein [Chitinophaga ginsengisegetis]